MHLQLLNFCHSRLQLILGAGNDADVEAALREVLCEGITDALAGTGDDGPGACLAVLLLQVNGCEVVQFDEGENFVEEHNRGEGTEANKASRAAAVTGHKFVKRG